jgi:16S rRNA processing protein RimM
MDLFVAGEIVKPRGLRGCVKVLSQLDNQSIITAELKYIYIEDISGRKTRYNLRKFDISGKFLFLELENIIDVDSAKSLIGSKVFLPVDVLADLLEGEYYWRDIIGMDVYNEDGKPLGRIESVFPTGSNDVYVCKGEREILLPAIADVIRKIDLDKRIMTVRLLAGL